jgi:RND family efflux transporter MFP subunit
MTPRSQLVVLALLTLVGSGGCGKPDEATLLPQAPPLVQVGLENVVVVTDTTLEEGPTFSGLLSPRREAVIRAQTGGIVEEMLYEPGQRVGAGALLARLDESAIRDAVASAASGVENARAVLEVTQRDEQRQANLAQAGAIPQRDLENARRATIGARAQLVAAEAQLAAARKQWTFTRLTAPFGGIISEKTASLGDVVSPGTPLYTLIDPSSMELEASVPVEALPDLRAGTPVQFTVTGYNGPFAGTLTRINPTADPATRQVRIYAEVPNQAGALVAGLYATGRVSTKSHQGLVAAARAVDERGVAPAVLRLRAGKVERIEVTLGARDAVRELVEIATGLTAGDTLLVGTAQALSIGTPVRVVRSE